MIRRIAGVCLLLAAVTANAQDAKPYASDIYYDFRKPLSPDLILFGDKEELHFKFGPDGLRITLPRDWKHPFGGVGCRTKEPIIGDFEITTSYEIIEAETPPKGFGVGVSLRVKKAESIELANVSRVVRGGGRQVVLWNRTIERPGEKPLHPEGEVPCTDKIGRLRLMRVGAMLHFARAAGLEGDNFQEVHKIDFGAGDIANVAVTAHTGRETAKADVRFIDLRIRSGAPPAPQARVVMQNPDERPDTPPRRTLTYALAGALGVTLVLVMGLGGWFLVRGRRANTEEARLAFTCPECGKKLKAKATAAGKKMKCSHCSQTVAVPS